MKISAPRHEKMDMLADALQEKLGLDLDLCQTVAVGIMERLWIYAAEFIQQGNIGKLSNARIAKNVGWTGDANWLIEEILVDRCHWLDRHETHRLIIHDWPEHCQDNVHTFLVKNFLLFADGSRPKLTRIPKEERSKILTEFDRRYPNTKNRMESAQVEPAERVEIEENALVSATERVTALEERLESACETPVERLNGVSRALGERSSALDESTSALNERVAALGERSPAPTQPHLTQPHLTQPHLTQPHLTQPSLALPSHSKSPPIVPPKNGGTGALKIEIGRKPRCNVSWSEEWNGIKQAIYGELDEEDIDPLIGVDAAVRGNGTIYLRSCGTPPEKLSPRLKAALEKHLVPLGINTIRIGDERFDRYGS